MRRQSPKARKRSAEAKPTRDGLVSELGRCELCGHSPGRTKPGNVAWKLVVHEISRGKDRLKAVDQRFAVLVLCWTCHERIHSESGWPMDRQLAVLKRSRPQDMDLPAFCRLIRRADGAITESDVDQFLN